MFIYTFVHIYIYHIHACMHACIHTYIHHTLHTYKHTYIHTYITLHYITLHISTFTFIHSYIHTYIHTYIHRNISTYVNIYNEGTWRGRLFWYSYAVLFPGLGSEHHVKPRRLVWANSLIQRFPPKSFWRPFRPILVPHPPTAPVAFDLVRLKRPQRPRSWTGVRSIRTVAGHATVSSPQARTGRP